jgi:hypothetical protein
VSVAVNNDDQGSDGEQGQPAVTLMDRIAECDDSSSDEDEGADRRQFIASKVANELEPYLLSKIIKKQDTAGGRKLDVAIHLAGGRLAQQINLFYP